MNRKRLLIALLPLAFLLYQLAWIPPTQGWRFDLANKQIVNSTSKAKVNFLVDIGSGELRTTVKEQPKLKLPSSPRRGPLVEPVLRIYPAQESRSERIPKNWIANFYSGETMTSTRKFSFPAVPIGFGDRYAVGTLETELYSLDLLNPDAKLQTFPSKFSFQVDSWDGPLPLQPTSESSFFRDNARNGIVEVFAIAPDGAITLVSYWRYLSPTQTDGVYCDGKIIVTVNPVTSAIEQHSAIDGSFLGNLQLSQPVDLAKTSWGFWGGEGLRVSDQEMIRFFDARTGVLRESQPANIVLAGTVNGRDDLAWGYNRLNAQFCIWPKDDLSNALCVLKTVRIPRDVAMMNASEITVLGNRFSLSIETYDLHSGRLIGIKLPLSWVMPLVIVIVVYYFGWSVLWFRASAKATAWPLLDQQLVSAIALAAFCLYGWSNHQLANFDWSDSRESFRSILWMTLGWLDLAIFWLVFGKARWIWRTLPAVALICGFLVVLKIKLPNPEPINAWAPIYRVILSTSVVGIALVAMRSVGWRIYDLNNRDSEAQAPKESSFKLVDCFVLLAIAAVLVATFKPFFPPINLSLFFVTSASICGLTSIGAMMLALSKRAWIFFTGIAVLVVSTAIITYDQLSHFYNPFSQFTNTTVILFCNSLAVPFFLAIPYRLRGWRWSRKPSTTGHP